MSQDSLQQAIFRLDPKLDEHWTSDGVPRVDAVAEMFGSPVTRSQITDLAHDLTRSLAEERGYPLVKDQESQAPTLTGAPPEDLAAAAAAGESDDAADPLVGFEPDRAYCQMAAQAWCEPEAAEIEMDVALATAFARILQRFAEGSSIDSLPEGSFALRDHPIIPQDEVVGMTPDVVCNDVDLIDRALAEFERQSNLIVEWRDKAINQLRDLGKRSELLNRFREKLLKAGKRPSNEEEGGIKAYLKKQHQIREERARRARAFADKLGGHEMARAVADQVQTGSAIDRAFGARPKATRGRPTFSGGS